MPYRRFSEKRKRNCKFLHRPPAQKYYKPPIACNFVSYGSNLVASVDAAYRPIVEEYLGKFEYYHSFHSFETPNLHWLGSRMQKSGQKVCFMAEYFLPDVHKLQKLPCPYEQWLFSRLGRDGRKAAALVSQMNR